MTDNWEQWEGRTVDGYVLGNYLGSSNGSAVFRTRSDDEPADKAIKLMAEDDADAERQLLRWKTASGLRHPNLIRILAVGRTAEGRTFFYAVEELAEENLAQIVPERVLTAEEACGMLSAVVAALEYVHGKGFVHGRICPANIMAAGDQVKLSSDSVREAGEMPRSASAYDAPEVAAHGFSAASDVWSLGITLVEALTQHAPAWDATRMSVPAVGEEIAEPFRGIAQRCLEIDPRKRCGLLEIGERLAANAALGEAGVIREAEIDSAIAPARKFTTWRRWIVPAVVVAVTIFVILRPRSPKGPTDGETAAVQSAATRQAPSQGVTARAAPVQAQPVPAPLAKQDEKRAPGGAAAPKGTKGAPVPTDDVVDRVMPEVAASARRTIEGRIKVRVKVNVDGDGKVTEARLAEAGPSKYFARVALEAARRWKFAPAGEQGEKREWTVLFVFSRARTEAAAMRARGN